VSLPAYPKYKPSGVEWLGDVPDEWEVRRLRFASTCNDEILTEQTDPDYLIEYVDISSVSLNAGIKTKELLEFEKAPSRARRKVKDGDCVISTVRTYLKAIAAIIKPSNNLIVSTGFAVVRPAEFIYSGFLSYFAQNQYFVESVVSESKGVSYPAISPIDLCRINICFPTEISEQQAIADYLDKKTGQIDELIQKKKELIEKLKEQRTALITHAVTKGIKAEGGRLKMKPSGVEWLGDIPEHWEVRRLKFVASEPLKYGANEAADLEDRDLPRFIRITDVNEDGTLKDESFRSLPKKTAEPFLLDDGDILLARSGATVGKSFLYSADWGISAFAGYLIRFRVDKTNFNSRFAKYCLMSKGYWAWIQSSLIQATIQNVSAEKYANLVLPLPSVIEQENITCYLDKKTGLIDKLIFRTETAILKLEEYRTAVITAVVTGKVRVSDMDVGYSSFEQEPLLAAEEMGGYGIE